MFNRLARTIANVTGSAYALLTACSIIMLWAVSGPAFGFSSQWQLVINTVTTIVTFLMVFFIQHTQNIDTKAIHLKLDDLLTTIDTAHDALVNIENDPERLQDAENAHARK